GAGVHWRRGDGANRRDGWQTGAGAHRRRGDRANRGDIRQLAVERKGNGLALRISNEDEVAWLANGSVVCIVCAEEVTRAAVIQIAMRVGTAAHEHAAGFARFEPGEVLVVFEVEPAQIHGIPVEGTMVQGPCGGGVILLPETMSHIEGIQLEETA